MISLPLITFFITKKYLFFGIFPILSSLFINNLGDEVYSAIVAVLVANLLIVIYVIMAIVEDRKFEKAEKAKLQ